MCRRLRAVCQSAASLWESVELQLSLSDPRALERTEGFLSFIIPRAAAVHKLAVAGERGGSAAAAAAAAEAGASGPLPHLSAAHLSLVFSNLVSALTLMGAWPELQGAPGCAAALLRACAVPLGMPAALLLLPLLLPLPAAKMPSTCPA